MNLYETKQKLKKRGQQPSQETVKVLWFPAVHKFLFSANSMLMNIRKSLAGDEASLDPLTISSSDSRENSIQDDSSLTSSMALAGDNDSGFSLMIGKLKRRTSYRGAMSRDPSKSDEESALLSTDPCTECAWFQKSGEASDEESAEISGDSGSASA